MYDQSFLEIEEIQGDEKWSFEVLESKYLTCKGAKKWEHAVPLDSILSKA